MNLALVPSALGKNVQTSLSDNGLDITYPTIDYIKYNTTQTFAFHVYNKSNGVPITQDVSCEIHLYTPEGIDVIESPLIREVGSSDYEIEVTAENFTLFGSYPMLVTCNSSTRGGFASAEVSVTPNGLAPISDVFLIFLYIIFFILSVFMIYLFIMNIYKLASASETILGVVFSWSFYIGLLVFYEVVLSYSTSILIRNNIGIFLTITAYTHVILPLISFFIGFFYRLGTKKRLPTPDEITGSFRYG